MAAVGCNLALSVHDTKPSIITEQSGHFSPFIIPKGSVGFYDAVFSSPVSRLSSGGRFGNAQFWLVDLTTGTFLTDYIDKESITYVHIETGKESFERPQQSTLFSSANCILSSSRQQADISVDGNTPSQFTCLLANGVDTFLNQELEWSMALKWCSIPNRFNTISSDRTCFIRVRKDNSIDTELKTVYIKPGCYLSADELARVITESFNEADLSLACVTTTKLVELVLFHPQYGTSVTQYPVLKTKQQNQHFVKNMLWKLGFWVTKSVSLKAENYVDCAHAIRAVQRELNNHGRIDAATVEPHLVIIRNDINADEVKYYIDVSPALARICGFMQIKSTRGMPVPFMAKKAAQLNYPQQFLLCCDVLRPSYILGGDGSTATQPILYHFKVPNPDKQALISVGNGVGQQVRVAHLRFDSLHFTMRDLDGRKLEIESPQSGKDVRSWLHIYMSGSKRRAAR